MGRLMLAVVLVFAAACGGDERDPNNIQVDPNGSPNNANGQTNGDTTSTNGDTTSTNGNTTSTNNGQTNGATNGETTNTNGQTQGTVSISGTATEGATDAPVLPIACAIRLYNPNLINASDPDLFADAVIRQRPFTINQWPTSWTVEDVGSDPVYAGILCDRDDDQQLDMIGGWHTEGSEAPQAITAPAEGIEIPVNRL